MNDTRTELLKFTLYKIAEFIHAIMLGVTVLYLVLAIFDGNSRHHEDLIIIIFFVLVGRGIDFDFSPWNNKEE